MKVQVAVVDANTMRARQYASALGSDVDVHVWSTPREVPGDEVVLDVALVSLRQIDGHGLQAGRALKARRLGTFVVVYGRPVGQPPPAREQVERAWKIDLYVPFVPDANDVVALVRPVVQARKQADRGSQAVDTGVAPPAPRPAPAPEEEDTSDEPTWRDLLTTQLTRPVLKQILTRDLFGRAARKG